jgi:hypothetical protein
VSITKLSNTRDLSFLSPLLAEVEVVGASERHSVSSAVL